jgi:predicted SAM-dependent methyltransferase|tara:strand:- start:79 stop:588 length:510 start_codon:yes stop_codon:yes gene_type:complete
MKLHIGGETPKDGWTIFNIQKKKHVDIVGSLEDLSRFGEDSIDEIYASHVFEHVKVGNFLKVLKDINRILKVDSRLLISVPDVDIIFRLFLNTKATHDVKFSLMRMIFGGQVDEHDFHYFGWNYELMSDFLIKANFSKFKKVESHEIFKDYSELKAYGHKISLNMIAIK